MIVVMAITVPENIDRATLLHLAGLAEVDPSVVARIYEGRPVRSLSMVRVRRAAVALGIELPNRDDDVRRGQR